ncbi:MAG: hypothetical protein U5L46_04875 [Agrobacterium sp.]|nr:hypothetical protein [Agrobacterium sp.]
MAQNTIVVFITVESSTTRVTDHIGTVLPNDTCYGVALRLIVFGRINDATQTIFDCVASSFSFGGNIPADDHMPLTDRRSELLPVVL